MFIKLAIKKGRQIYKELTMGKIWSSTEWDVKSTSKEMQNYENKYCWYLWTSEQAFKLLKPDSIVGVSDWKDNEGRLLVYSKCCCCLCIKPALAAGVGLKRPAIIHNQQDHLYIGDGRR